MDFKNFGDYIRELREAKRSKDRSFSVRGLAKKLKIQASYLSRLESGSAPPPSNEVIRKFAIELKTEASVLMFLAGRIPEDLIPFIKKRPSFFNELIEQVKDLPEQAVLRVVREVRDGKW